MMTEKKLNSVDEIIKTNNQESVALKTEKTENIELQDTVSTKNPKKVKNNLKSVVIVVITIIIFILVSLYAVWFYNQEKKYLSKTKPESSLAPDSISTEEEKKTAPVKYAKAAQARGVFGFSLLKQLESEESGNIIISPPSIATALSMVLNGAQGQTKKDMSIALEVLDIDIDILNQDYKYLLANLIDPDPDVEISIANSIWLQTDALIEPDFMQTNQNYYQAQIEQLDFNSFNSASRINSWVKDNTKGKIKRIVDSSLDSNTLMLLINALYFNGSWTYEFDKSLTEDNFFFTRVGDSLEHPFMQQDRDDFLYFENDDFQAIKLPYGQNQRLAMVVILPILDLQDIKNDFNFDNFKKWIKLFKRASGTLFLPRLKLEFEKELNDALSFLGMDIAFSDFADFSNISPLVSISKVKHKTYIEIDEKGTEAAAVTSVGLTNTSIAEKKAPFYMEVNKPFFFAIYDSQLEEIVFMGFVYEPI
ncbi:serpin family protein [Patescibacteria group bacterium]